MNDEFYLSLSDVSFEVIISSILVFSLTMLVKWPIKKYTSKLDEDKRKAVNTIIFFIPMVISFILNVFYYGIFKSSWLTVQMFEATVSTYAFSVIIYTCVSRSINIICGLKKSIDDGKCKETISFIKYNIKVISKTLKIDEKKLSSIIAEIEKLITIKNELGVDTDKQNISSIEHLNKQIENLKQERSILEIKIDENEEQLKSYQSMLKNKE